jgi:hypothetical protein
MGAIYKNADYQQQAISGSAFQTTSTDAAANGSKQFGTRIKLFFEQHK